MIPGWWTWRDAWSPGSGAVDTVVAVVDIVQLIVVRSILVENWKSRV